MSLFNNLTSTLDRSSSCEGNACTTAEQTIRPSYNVKETTDAFQLKVRLPGVARDGLEVTAENDEIRIAGRRTWTKPEGWTPVHRETPAANFELVLTHDNDIDADKIVAELRDGVLNVTLPKHEAVKPRKIAVA